MLLSSAFFIEADRWRAPFALTDDEARHAVAARRVRPGDEVSALDGQGRSGLFRVTDVGKARVGLELVAERRHERAPLQLVLALGFTKAGRRDYLLEKAAELGVAEIVYFSAARSVGEAGPDPKPVWFERLKAGCKQSGNPFLPRLSMTRGGVRTLASLPGEFASRHVACPRQGAAPLDPAATLAQPGRHLVVLGPEGGLDQGEQDVLLDAGFAPLSLGSFILRAETAALMLASLFAWANARSGV